MEGDKMEGAVNDAYTSEGTETVTYNVLEDSFRQRFSAMTLAWRSIDVYTTSHIKLCSSKRNTATADQGRKHILQNVSGVVKPGTLVAIMGSSGAGKSTLMNVLTGRSGGDMTVHGQVTVNGCEIGTLMGDISAYVEQEDAFIPSLTVIEQLMFRALLRMDKSYDKQQRIQRVKDVIRELSLTKCANTMIGDERIKGISGGERKRVAFASEILTDPPLIFLDEPTSGLDSYLARNLIQVLKNMASRGRTIVTTIHQPSSEIFTMFDELLLMADGRVVFMGPTKDAMLLFRECGLQCPTNYNPADFYLDNLSIIPNQEDDYVARTQGLVDAFERSENYRNIQNYLEKTKERSLKEFLESAPAGNRRFRANIGTQLVNVFWRSWVTVIRDPASLKFRGFQTFVIGLILGLIYLNQSINQQGVMNINGLLFILVVNTSFSSQFMVVNVFPLEMAVILRDFNSKLYSVEIYYLCKTLADLPLQIIFPVILNAIVYWMVGLYDDFDTFVISCCVLIFVSNIAASFGFLISALAGTVQTALALAPPIMAPLMLFGGLFLNSGSIPDYFLWLKYISWFSYSVEVITVNQWKNVQNITCDPREPCRFTSGKDVNKFLSFSEDNYKIDFIMMAVLFVGFRVVGYFCLLARAKWCSRKSCCC